MKLIMPAILALAALMASSCTISHTITQPAVETTVETTVTATSTNTSIVTVFHSVRVESAVEVVGDGMKLSIWTDKTAYVIGEAIKITAQFENLSAGTITYTLGSIGEPVLAIYLNSSVYGGRILYEPGITAITISPLVTTAKLGPGQSLTRTVVWNQKINNLQAPDGHYQISAGIRLGDYYADKNTFNFGGSLDVYVRGGVIFIPAKQAITTALQDPYVKDWFNSQGADVICELPGPEYVRITSSGIQPATHQELEDRKSRQKGQLGIVYLQSDGLWYVGFNSTTITDNRLYAIWFTAYVDAVSGKVTKIGDIIEKRFPP